MKECNEFELVNLTHTGAWVIKSWRPVWYHFTSCGRISSVKNWNCAYHYLLKHLCYPRLISRERFFPQQTCRTVIGTQSLLVVVSSGATVSFRNDLPHEDRQHFTTSTLRYKIITPKRLVPMQIRSYFNWSVQTQSYRSQRWKRKRNNTWRVMYSRDS